MTTASRRSLNAVLLPLLALAAGPSFGQGPPPRVTAPPESFFQSVPEKDREAARAFYKKHIDAGGLSIAAAAEVADEALERTGSKKRLLRSSWSDQEAFR